jgi:hypothetical protein
MADEFSPAVPYGDMPATGHRSFWSRLFSTQTLVLTTAVLVIFHSVLLLLAGVDRFVNRNREAMEVELGTYRYDSPTAGLPGSLELEFDLHVSLLEKCDRLGRHLLHNHKHRVRQSVEELLRKARDEDFHDPAFTDLKRQIQEGVNATLGERVVAEVILTNVAVQRPEQQATEQAEPASAPLVPALTKYDGQGNE